MDIIKKRLETMETTGDTEQMRAKGVSDTYVLKCIG